MKLISGSRYRMEERNEVRTIEIPKVTQQDAGLYRVTIENDLGREQATARLDVISEFYIVSTHLQHQYISVELGFLYCG